MLLSAILEELLARKMLRSISQISDGSEQEISKELERKLSRKASRKPALEKQKSVKEVYMNAFYTVTNLSCLVQYFNLIYHCFLQLAA